MSRFILTALAGAVLLTGCPSPGGDTVEPGTSDQPDSETPAFKTQASVTLSLSGAILRVDHVETALFRIEGGTEVVVPGTGVTIRRDDLPRTVSLTDLHGSTTYRLKAQAYDATNQAAATNSTDIVVGSDTPPASQSLKLSILEIPFAGSISQP
ncbi:hypothetical protein J7643_18255 [bacterium]|nr:hypothetical protein [bacterium]